MPYAASTYVFYVRQDKLAEAGLPPPDTWEAALAAAQAINAPDEGFWGWGMQFGNSCDTRASFLAQLGAYGGSLWDEAGRPAIDSAATRQVLDLLREAWESGIVPADALSWDDTSNNHAYQGERVGMVLNAGSILEYLRTEDRDLLDRTQVIVVPAGPAGRYVSGTFSQWGIFKNSPNVQRCFELSEWLFAPDQLRGYYEAAGGLFLPTYTALLQDEFWQQPHLQVVAETLPDTYPPGYPGPTTPWALDGLSSNIIPQLIQRVLVDGWDNEPAITEADEALQQLYDDWQAQ
jgi:ABC-type glycerol-3-phosphate transport system substrate-binding protein